MKYKINEEILHVCYFISKIPDCKNFLGIYYKEENGVIIDCYDKIYKCKFKSGIFNVIENNLYPASDYELIQFSSYFNKKYFNKIRSILDYDLGDNVISPSLIGDLHITYGLSKDISIHIIRENNLLIDEKCIYEYIRLNSG